MAQLYVIYDKQTTRIIKERSYSKAHYASEAAAKAAVTRFDKKGICNKVDVAIASANDFYTNIEKTEVVTNLLSGKQVRQSVNTPACCDVSSETYWSM
ncbi:hypothetical protein UFOVP257_272 [uncultured Caudovirales phage]|uniref:Uncharacterized protein n=1 Tax=uncultured Caudovirales phage TaxID=2100421 RepID=A0A6J5LKN6_9CAUD|nr:hypothetical protein UFOVP257_272 [uncultured Caudovirales phage]